VIWVDETTVTPVAMISEYPVRVSFTVAPDRKLEPPRFVILTGHPRFPETGRILVTVGAGSITMNPFVSVPD